MRSVRLAAVALALASAPFLSVPSLNAQEAPPPEAEAAPPPSYEAEVVLPEVVVEAAPAKRNVKKQTLRATGSGTAGSSGEATTALPGVVVEGEKVVRTLRDTTTSIGVVTGAQIQEQQIEDLQGALNSQANVLATEGSGGNNGFVIRGLNSEGLTRNNAPAAAPLISVVIDGATQNPEATRRGARGLWDVEQVEVLRGPQTSLQARNSLAGSIFIKTKDPTYKWETIIEGTAAGQDWKSGGFVINAPIANNQAALRISGQSFQRNHNISYGNPEFSPLDEDILRTMRGKLLLEPDSIPGLSALFTIARVQDTPAVMTVSPPFEDRELAAGASIDFRATETTNYISDIGYEVVSGVTVRSITAYADTETVIGSPASDDFQRNTVRDGGDFTQDLRVEFENSGNGLSGVAGLFYGSFKFTADAFDTAFSGFVTVQDLVSSTQTESMAAYADLRYRFWDRFVFIGGGRILRDKVESSSDGVLFQDPFAVLQPFPIPTQGLAVPSSFSEEFIEVLPKVGITYDLTADQTVGVTYNKGYRNGFQELNLNTGVYNTVKPEYLDAYEVSYRSNWANDTISFNANAFYYDYKDQQVGFEEDLYNFLPYPVSIILNADSSQAYGAEFDARWRPLPPLQLTASLGLMRTEFESFNSSQGDFTGNEMPEAPAYTIAAGGMWKDPSGWFTGANLRYTDGYYSGGDLQNSSLRFVDSYMLVDARVGYEWDHFTLTVFAKNLFDEDYVTSIGTFTPPNTPSRATVGDEQLFGVTFRGEF
jgi:iron complex outermembrane recepter protein